MENNILRIFLIDFENVKRAGLEGLENCTQQDRVIILYSDACDTITFDIHQQLMQTTTVIEYQHIKAGGKDSLDHQLSSYLGYLICQNISCEFYIVSRDKGFEFITDFWEKKNIDIKQVINLNKVAVPETIVVETVKKTTPATKAAPATKKKATSTSNILAPTEAAINTALKNFPEYQKQLVKIITENTSKTSVNNSLNKLVPSTKRGAVAAAIRPLIINYSIN